VRTLVLTCLLVPTTTTAAADAPVLDPQVAGIAVSVEGGTTGFFDHHMRAIETSEVGATWGLRLIMGTRTSLALEARYTGSATPIATPLGDSRRTLLGNGLEGDLRWNLARGAVTPFVFVGFGFDHEQVSGRGVTLATMGMSDQVDAMVFPIGAGVALRRGDLVVELRGAFRPCPNGDLVRLVDGGYAAMNAWEASAALGWTL